MRIKMKVTSASPDGVLNEGKSYDVVDAKGKQLVAGGYATEVAVAPPQPEEEVAAEDEAPIEPETATEPEPEVAVAPPQRNPSRSRTR